MIKKICPILIVDDDEDLCHILEAVITKKCSVHCEHTLTTATEYLNQGTPEIIFLDNNLPDGLGVTAIAPMLLEHPGMKIVFMTAQADDGIREKALAQGASRFIAKPFKGATINQIITSLRPDLQG